MAVDALLLPRAVGRRDVCSSGPEQEARDLENFPHFDVTRLALSIHTRQVKSSLYINNGQPYGSLSNVLRRPAVVEGSGRR